MDMRVVEVVIDAIDKVQDAFALHWCRYDDFPNIGIQVGLQLRCGLVGAGAINDQIDAEFPKGKVTNFRGLREPHRMSRDRKMIVPCLDAMVPAAMNRVEFQEKGMLPDIGAGVVQQDKVAAALLVKEPSEQQFAHSAEAVDRDACHVCALVAESLLAQDAGVGK